MRAVSVNADSARMSKIVSIPAGMIAPFDHKHIFSGVRKSSRDHGSSQASAHDYVVGLH